MDFSEIIEAINDRNSLFKIARTDNSVINVKNADFGVNLHDQFVGNFWRQEYKNVYKCDGSDEDIMFDQDDILHVVNSIDVHKSSGIDYLPTLVLKDCVMVLLDQLVYHLFNQSMTLGTFPDRRKAATVTPVKFDIWTNKPLIKLSFPFSPLM